MHENIIGSNLILAFDERACPMLFINVLNDYDRSPVFILCSYFCVFVALDAGVIPATD